MLQNELPRTQKTLGIKNLAVQFLISDPRNPRHHNDGQVRQIARSIKCFGFNAPVLVDANNQIIAGHGRVLAAKLLGITEVPTICLEHLTATQARAFAIADNRLTENSSWNEKLLGEIFLELSAEDLSFSLEATGFSLDEIDLKIEALGGDDKPDPRDQVPPLTDTPSVSKLGDLFQLGRHRLLCGDATNEADITCVMNGQQAAMCFTDPPYNVNYANSTKDKLRGTHRPILNDNLGEGFEAFLAAVCANILAVTEGGVYICMSSSELHSLQHAFVSTGGHWSTFLIWAKQTFTLGRSDYQRQYEPILYGWRKGVERYWSGVRDQGDVWFYNKPAKCDLHPTMKPVELVMRAIRNSSERDDVVFDPFLGSGTTLIAAERTGRVCHSVELDPRYVDVAVQRWQQHTGEQAIHVGTGKTFHELAMEVRHG